MTSQPPAPQQDQHAQNAALPTELARCLSIDLEVSTKTATIHALAAYRPDTGDSLHFDRTPTPSDWQKLEDLADQAEFLVGHNLIAFDAPHLRAANPSFTALYLPQVDTLRLNPLAFPKNPYHHLVKHYRDGALIRSRRTDPLLDSQLTLQALANQVHQLKTTDPTLLSGFHHLTTRTDGAGFGAVFDRIRSEPAPSPDDAQSALAHLLAGFKLPRHRPNRPTGPLHAPMASRIHPRLAPSRRHQLGHIPMGLSPVPRDSTPPHPPTRHPLRGPQLPLVLRAPRRHRPQRQGTRIRPRTHP